MEARETVQLSRSEARGARWMTPIIAHFTHSVTLQELAEKEKTKENAII